jgi:hypothetical protein
MKTISGSGGILVHLRRRDLPRPRIEYCAGDFFGYVAHESKTSVIVVVDKELAVRRRSSQDRLAFFKVEDRPLAGCSNCERTVFDAHLDPRASWRDGFTHNRDIDRVVLITTRNLEADRRTGRTIAREWSDRRRGVLVVG